MDDEYESPDFDTIRIKQFIEEQTNVNIILYFITIVLYVISFTYLFRKDSTEYMIWILLFILNFVTPLIWATDMFKLISVIDIEKGINPSDKVKVEIKYASGDVKIIDTLCRIDTKNELEYYKNGGILQYVLRNMI